MTRRSEQLILGLSMFPTGNRGRWREADSRAEEAYSLTPFEELARQCEEARMDYLFVADGPNHDSSNFERNPFRFLEALTLTSALVGTTSHIGLIPTLSTTYNEPYNLARYISSLDHLSNGRAGWNVVTSFAGAQHFGTAGHLAHDTRYERAEEFVDAVDLFWRSWDEGALVIDRESGQWGDPRRVATETFAGDHFHVQGPLNLPRSPQGRPVVSQAGGSEPGKRLGARTADLMFSVGASRASALATYTDLKQRALAFGRTPSDLKVMMGYAPIIADTEADALEIRDHLVDLVGYDEGLKNLESMFGEADLSDLAPDARFPLERLPDPTRSNGVQSLIAGLVEFVHEQRPTLRGLVNETLFGVSGSTGGLRPYGTVSQIADSMLDAFNDHAADGFVFGAPVGLASYRNITHKLVPELQERGAFPREYEGNTLRENLGLSASSN